MTYLGRVDIAVVKRGCASQSYQSTLKKSGRNREDLVDTICWDFQKAFAKELCSYKRGSPGSSFRAGSKQTREGGFRKRR